MLFASHESLARFSADPKSSISRCSANSALASEISTSAIRSSSRAALSVASAVPVDTVTVAAAGLLHWSQSSVTRAVQDLEHYLAHAEDALDIDAIAHRVSELRRELS